MSADNKAAAAWDDYVSRQRKEKIGELERQLNAANQRIKRLEEAGDEMFKWSERVGQEYWIKAKETKP